MGAEFGQNLEAARTRQALSQSALAAQLGVTQQTVSRWEKGTSRPRGRMINSLGMALGLSASELAVVSASRPAPATESESGPLPVRPLLSVLPFMALTPPTFERFIAELLARRFPSADVTQLGDQGDDQRGYDILVVHEDGSRHGVQCKRERQFGPVKVREAVDAGELDVDRSFIALARTATADSRFEMDKHDAWQMWDQVDLSRQVRALAQESALYIVRAYFPSHVEPFLGVATAGPWMTAEDFYRNTPLTLLNHRQPLVGRDAAVTAVAHWASDPGASNIGLVIGRGGLGKSKFLWEVATSDYDREMHFRFLGVDQVPGPADFDSLPRSGGLVVVVDDAQGIEGIAGIAAQLAQQRPDAKLLLSTRPSGEAMLDSEIWKLGQMPQQSSRWLLDDLPYAEACKLVSSLIGRSVIDPVTKQLASISTDCPFIAVVAADLLKQGLLAAAAFASDLALRAEVLRSYSELSATQSGSADAAARRGVLTALAAFQPVRLHDPDFEVAITALTGVQSWDEVNGRIRELEDIGLVLRRGGAVRVVPDMLGDVLLGQASFDDRANRATTFLSRAQDAASGAPLQHLITNASRMDWHVRDGAASPVDMVGQLWATLRAELLAGTFDQQMELLRLVATVAYYQPGQALGVVKAVLALDVGPLPEPENGVWAASRSTVLHALVPVLRNVGYHLDLLPEVLDLLWELAQEDERATNQHPDHPLRVLSQMADLGTGKPFVYLDVVIDAVTRWLGQSWTLSPLDVLEPMLAVEGSDEISSDLSLTFYPFAISPDSVRSLRARVLELAAAQARSDDIRAAVRGVRTLEHGIRGPFGMFGRAPTSDERAAWATEFLPTIRLLGQIGSESDHDPAVRIAIRQAVGWHAENGSPTTKSAAKAALKRLATSADDELALCLHDGWGRMALRASRNYEEAERAQSAEFHRVAKALTEAADPDEVLERLETRLTIERDALGGIGSSGRFLWEVFSVDPGLAVRLCEGALAGDYPVSSQFVAQAIATLALAGDDRAIALASAMADSGSVDLIRAAAWALSWNRGSRSYLLDGEVSLLGRLAQHDDEHVRSAMGRAAYLIGLSDRAVALDLIARIDFGSSGKVAAEALSAFTMQSPLSWADTAATLRRAILAKLVACNSIDEFELMSTLAELSLVEPLGVTRLLLARVERQSGSFGTGYDALPYRWEPRLKVSETPKLALCLREIRRWMCQEGHGQHPYSFNDDAAELYTLIAGGWNEQAIAVLADAGSGSTEPDLLAVARILSHAPLSVFFDRVELVARLLRQSTALGEEQAERVFYSLLPTNRGVFAFTSDEPSDGEIAELDRARRVARELAPGSIERRFFDTLAEALEGRLNLRSRRPERFDRRDW